MKIQLYITIYLDKYYIIDHFDIFKGTYYPVLNSSYLQIYLSYLVELGIILKHKRSSVMVNFRVEHPFCVLSHICYQAKKQFVFISISMVTGVRGK